MSQYQDLTFDIDRGEGRGTIFARDTLGNTARLTFLDVGADRIEADHTGVPDEMGGRGVGKALVAQLVNYARENGLTIVPKCSFVKAMLDRKPEWQDVLAA